MLLRHESFKTSVATKLICRRSSYESYVLLQTQVFSVEGVNVSHNVQTLLSSAVMFTISAVLL